MVELWRDRGKMTRELDICFLLRLTRLLSGSNASRKFYDGHGRRALELVKNQRVLYKAAVEPRLRDLDTGSVAPRIVRTRKKLKR
jgi:hypothetical protein